MLRLLASGCANSRHYINARRGVPFLPPSDSFLGVTTLYRSLSRDATSCLIGQIKVTCQFLSQSLVRNSHQSSPPGRLGVVIWPQSTGSAWRRGGHLNKVRIPRGRENRQEMLRKQTAANLFQKVCVRRYCHLRDNLPVVGNISFSPSPWSGPSSCLGYLSIFLPIF